MGEMRVVDPMEFPAPCSCTDPKGHRPGCPSDQGDVVFASHPGESYVNPARVVQQSYPGEDYDVAVSWGLPRNRVEAENMRGAR